MKTTRNCLYRQLLLLLLILAPAASGRAAFDPQLAPFSVKVNGELMPHAVGLRAVMPGDNLSVSFPGSARGEFLLRSGTQILDSGRGTLRWKAPQVPGLTSIMVQRASDKAKVTLQVMVMRPASEVSAGRLNGYRIGDYPPPLRNLDSYAIPRGFIEVTPELSSLQVSPHFTLGQFLCKQQGGYPKYMLLRPKLLDKLEFLLADLNAHGIRADSFVVMSGYRTPYYNHSIKNVAHSRHVYGGAADIYVDVRPVDGLMDDLNSDGKVDIKDASVLYDIADSYVERTGRTEFTGGVGLYRSTAAHGPFVHVDVRGTRARW